VNVPYRKFCWRGFSAGSEGSAIRRRVVGSFTRPGNMLRIVMPSIDCPELPKIAPAAFSVRVKKTRQNNKQGPRSTSIGPDLALVAVRSIRCAPF